MLRRVLVSTATLAVSLGGADCGLPRRGCGGGPPALRHDHVDGRWQVLQPGPDRLGRQRGNPQEEADPRRGVGDPPGVSVSKTKSVERVAQLKASVSTTTSASAAIQAKVLGKVEAKVDVQLEAEVSVTTTSAESVIWTIPASSNDRYYACSRAARLGRVAGSTRCASPSTGATIRVSMVELPGQGRGWCPVQGRQADPGELVLRGVDAIPGLCRRGLGQLTRTDLRAP